jgi:Ca2+-binding EF-hand superfamily protein
LLTRLGTRLGQSGADLDEDALRAKFEQIDTSGDGSLDEDELTRLLETIGLDRLDPTIVPNLIRLADDDGNGTIEWPEFLKIFQILHKMNSGKEKATEAVEELQAA